jgi:hypothetical protein
MHKATAVFIKNEIEPGWLILKEDVPLGKRYEVDLDRTRTMTLQNRDTGRSLLVRCIYVLSPGHPGYLPIDAFRIEYD